MIIPVIFDISPNVEAPYLIEFYRWVFMQSASGAPVIAQEEYFQDPSAFSSMGRTEMHANIIGNVNHEITYDYIQRIMACPIPNDIICSLIADCGSASEAAVFLKGNNYTPLEQWLLKVIDEAETRQHEKAESFLMFRQFETFEIVAKRLGMSILYYDWAMFRPPVYHQAAYIDDSGFFNGVGIDKRYVNFCKEIEHNHVPILTNKEILALMLNPEYICLLSQYNAPPKYKVGIATQSTWFAPLVQQSNVNNLDAIVQGVQCFGKENALLRLHPGDSSRSTYAGFGLQQDISPTLAEFILKCERTISIASNVSIETMMWGRGAYSLLKGLYKTHGMQNLADRPADVDYQYLSFIAFAFYVPVEMLCDSNYLHWRVREKPSECELYQKHLQFYLKCKNIPQDLLNNSTQRYEEILRVQGFNKMGDLLSDDDQTNRLQDDIFQILSELRATCNNEQLIAAREMTARAVFELSKNLKRCKQMEQQLISTQANWDQAARYAKELEKQRDDAVMRWTETQTQLDHDNGEWRKAAEYGNQLETKIKKMQTNWEQAASYAEGLEKQRDDAVMRWTETQTQLDHDNGEWRKAAEYINQLETSLSQADEKTKKMQTNWEQAASYAEGLEKQRDEAISRWNDVQVKLEKANEGWDNAAKYASRLQLQLANAEEKMNQLNAQLQTGSELIAQSKKRKGDLFKAK